MEKMRLLNTYVNNVTLDEAVEFLLQKIREQTPAYVVEVNVDVVVKMETDLVLRQITDNADLTLVDGQPLPRRGVCPVQLIQQHPEQAVDSRLRMRKTLAEAGDVPQELLDNLGIRDEWMQRYPHELSGGELQRFCIARALATRPRYLICDEVSTMLDAVTQAHIWRVLLDYAEREGAGMLLVSHTPALTERVATRKVKLSRSES